MLAARRRAFPANAGPEQHGWVGSKPRRALFDRALGENFIVAEHRPRDEDANGMERGLSAFAHPVTTRIDELERAGRMVGGGVRAVHAKRKSEQQARQAVKVRPWQQEPRTFSSNSL